MSVKVETTIENAIRFRVIDYSDTIELPTLNVTCSREYSYAYDDTRCLVAINSGEMTMIPKTTPAVIEIQTLESFLESAKEQYENEIDKLENCKIQ